MEGWWCEWNGGVDRMIEGAWTYLLRQLITIGLSVHENDFGG